MSPRREGDSRLLRVAERRHLASGEQHLWLYVDRSNWKRDPKARPDLDQRGLQGLRGAELREGGALRVHPDQEIQKPEGRNAHIEGERIHGGAPIGKPRPRVCLLAAPIRPDRPQVCLQAGAIREGWLLRAGAVRQRGQQTNACKGQASQSAPLAG